MNGSMGSPSAGVENSAAPNSTSPTPGPSNKKKRCHTGCAICRVRKVKCDERPGGCSNCERLQLKCPGSNQDKLYSVEELKLPPSAGIKRKKTYRSCNDCRSSKTRCSGERPVCQRCVRKGIKCVYDADPDPAWTKTIRNSLTSDASEQRHDEGQYDEAQAADSVAMPPPPRSYAADTNAFNKHFNSLEWLYVVQLPDKEKVRFLLDQYFENVHPLRCFGFLHQPSFMQKFEERLPSSPSGNALLYTVCALGAKFALLSFVNQLPPQDILAAGDKWAREASRLVTADLDTISVENLMAAVLLHDHELRVGRFASAFMLSGISARMAQALQVNLEYSADMFCTSPHSPSPVLREARRRLMWSCYVMDATVGSGVDQLTLINNSDIKIQLPVNERLFLRQKPAITETLEAGRALRYVATENMNSNPAEHMGMAAYYVRLTSYRKQVLTYVKHLDTAQSPWLAESEFSGLDNCLRHWYKNLPFTLQFTPETQFQRHQSSQLGALVLLHVTFHQTNVDLYRIGTPRLFKIRENIHFPPEKLGYLTSIRQTCFHHASQISRILQYAAHYGVKILADTWLAIVAHDTNRVMLYYLTNFVDGNSLSNRGIVEETLSLINSNLQIMKMMIPLFSVSSSLYEASANLLRQSGVGGSMNELASSELADQGGEASSQDRSTAPNTPVQSTPEWVLNPLAIYRLARKSVSANEKHQPELHPSPDISGHPQPANQAQQQSQGWYLPQTANPSQQFVLPASQQQQHQQRAGDTNSYTVPQYLAPPASGLRPSQSSSTGFTPANVPPPPQQPSQPQQQQQSQQQQQQQQPNPQMFRPKINITEDMFFASNLDTIWQPAETILESTGMAPWDSDVAGSGGATNKFGANNGDIDMFMPNGSWMMPQS